MSYPRAADTEKWIEFIASVCSPLVYLDIGAGDGYDCAKVKSFFPDCRCVAIDPVAPWCDESETVDRYRDVIAAENDYRVFHVKSIPGIHGLYSRESHVTDKALALPARRLDHFCEREGIKNIDAMKIDVEGAAWDVLMGAGDLLDTVKIIHVETEWLPLFKGQQLEVEVFRLLGQSGMKKIWENRVEDLGQGDSIWVRQ